MDRGEGGPVHPASTYFMKSPPRQVRDDIAGPALEAWINGEDAGAHAAAASNEATSA
jgi:myo-inositol-1-phosphate synthase